MYRDDAHRTCSRPCSLQGSGAVSLPHLAVTRVRGWKAPCPHPGLLLEQLLPSSPSPGKEGEPRWRAQGNPEGAPMPPVSHTERQKSLGPFLWWPPHDGSSVTSCLTCICFQKERESCFLLREGPRCRGVHTRAGRGACTRLCKCPWTPTCVSVKPQRSCGKGAGAPNSHLCSIGPPGRA